MDEQKKYVENDSYDQTQLGKITSLSAYKLPIITSALLVVFLAIGLTVFGYVLRDDFRRISFGLLLVATVVTLLFLNTYTLVTSIIAFFTYYFNLQKWFIPIYYLGVLFFAIVLYLPIAIRFIVSMKTVKNKELQIIKANVVGFCTNSYVYNSTVAFELELEDKTIVKTQYIFRTKYAEVLVNKSVDIKLHTRKNGTQIAILV